MGICQQRHRYLFNFCEAVFILLAAIDLGGVSMHNHIWLTNNQVCMLDTCLKNQCFFHTMDLLWEKFQWTLPIYMKPICFQSYASVVCSVTAAIFIVLPEETKCVFLIYWSNKLIYEFRRTNPQELKYWSTFCVTSWDITYWCSINLFWQKLMERMSEHTGFISSYPLLITAACTNAGGQMKGSHPRAADRCPFVPRHSLVRLPLSCRWKCYVFCETLVLWRVSMHRSLGVKVKVNI